MSAIIFAVLSPPTGQADGSHSPLAMADAKASHPAYPQPPQLLPGNASLMATSYSSTSTDNNLPAIPSAIPIINPTPPTMATAYKIPVIVVLNAKISIYASLYNTGKSGKCYSHKSC